VTPAGDQNGNPFDLGAAAAAEYDRWYDSPVGRSVLEREARCIAELLDGTGRPWLDLGTGSGRFAGTVGAELGLDPARELLELAARRAPAVVQGTAEALPIRDGSLGAVLSVTVFEFLPAADVAMREVARVLRRGGRFALGLLQKGGAWATAYEEQGRDPSSFFHGARFFSLEEVRSLAATAGLQAGEIRSTLFEAPGAAPSERVIGGLDTRAGFVAVAFTKQRDGG
jgi:SAM-dependent methyltransferase